MIKERDVKIMAIKITADKKTMDADHGIKAVKQGGIACHPSLGIEC